MTLLIYSFYSFSSLFICFSGLSLSRTHFPPLFRICVINAQCFAGLRKCLVCSKRQQKPCIVYKSRIRTLNRRIFNAISTFFNRCALWTRFCFHSFAFVFVEVCSILIPVRFNFLLIISLISEFIAFRVFIVFVISTFCRA